MAEEQNPDSCNGSCGSCGSSSCGSRTEKQRTSTARANVKHVIGVVSGKGGVGKSLVTCLLASELTKRGYKVGVLDADITGPSIPKAFGLKGRLMGDKDGILPFETESGIKAVSTNLMLDQEDAPVAWRGPVVTGLLKQFFGDTNWEEIDYLLVDMPPGTSDVFLTVMQSMNLDGIVTVSAPQQLVSMIVGKAVNLAHEMNIPVLGLVENMAYFKCGKNNGDEHTQPHPRVRRALGTGNGKKHVNEHARKRRAQQVADIKTGVRGVGARPGVIGRHHAQRQSLNQRVAHTEAARTHNGRQQEHRKRRCLRDYDVRGTECDESENQNGLGAVNVGHPSEKRTRDQHTQGIYREIQSDVVHPKQRSVNNQERCRARKRAADQAQNTSRDERLLRENTIGLNFVRGPVPLGLHLHERNDAARHAQQNTRRYVRGEIATCPGHPNRKRRTNRLSDRERKHVHAHAA